MRLRGFTPCRESPNRSLCCLSCTLLQYCYSFSLPTPYQPETSHPCDPILTFSVSPSTGFVSSDTFTRSPFRLNQPCCPDITRLILTTNDGFSWKTEASAVIERPKHVTQAPFLNCRNLLQHSKPPRLPPPTRFSAGQKGVVRRTKDFSGLKTNEIGSSSNLVDNQQNWHTLCHSVYFVERLQPGS